MIMMMMMIIVIVIINNIIIIIIIIIFRPPRQPRDLRQDLQRPDRPRQRARRQGLYSCHYYYCYH